MNKHTISEALLILLTAATTHAVDLVNNLGAESAGIREVVAGESVGASFLTRETWFSAERITLEVQGTQLANSALRVRLFEVRPPAPDGTEHLSPVGEFEFADKGSFPEHVSYLTTTSILLAPQTEYAVLVGYPAAAGNVVLPSPTLCASTEAGGEAGISFTAEWYSFWESGQEFWISQPPVGPIKFQLSGTPVENRCPVVEAAVPSVPVLWPPNGALVPVEILGVIDPDGDPLTIQITRVEQNEQVGYEPDAIFAGDKLALRAQRRPSAGGRVYVVHFQATDGKANGQTYGTVRVIVPHSPSVPILFDGTGAHYLDSTKPSFKWGKVR